MDSLVAIVGPTGIGKSRLAIRLAQIFSGEIVGADSRQVYRHMDIGTAKPSQEELSLVLHHLVDIIDPDKDFNLAQYQQLAYNAIDEIQSGNKLPFLVGGSGLYIWAVLEGWEIPQVQPDPEFRRSLEEKAARGGAEELYAELSRIDPAATEKIDPRNVRRVIRALEVYKDTGIPFSQLQSRNAPLYHTLIIGLTVDRAELYRRIDSRVDKMIEQGLVEEVQNLVNMGYGFNLKSMSGIGYKQIGMFLRDELSLEDAIQKIKFETHRFARNQYSWFRLKDERIHWFDIKDEKSELEIEALVTAFISG